MPSFLIERIDGDRVIISRDGRSYTLPRDAFKNVPHPGTQTTIMIQAVNNDESITTALAHQLLNELLAPSP